MKITSVKIHNWRSIKYLEINFQEIMIFIGQNNHGKSNVLSSLLFFFGEIPCTELDFKKGTDELFVEVEFSNLDEHDKSQFSKYVTSNEHIKVRKLIRKGENFEYHGYCEIPQEDWLKEEKISDYAKRETISVTPLKDYVPATGRITKENVKEAQEKYISEKRDSLIFQYDLETTNFLGLKTVAQGIFGNIFFIPAVKNATEEFNVKGKSIFNQLLSNVINEMSSSNQQYIDAKSEITKLTQILNKNITDGTLNTDRPEQLTKLEHIIEAELKKWHTTINIEITPPDIDEVLKVGTTVWIDDGVPTDIVRKGHGLQRALIFALIKAWANISKEIKQKEEQTEEKAKRKASESNYFIFEEPELYLHPQAQRELFYSLKELSRVNNQVLLSTHSSSFVDLDMYKSICKVYKTDVSEGSKILQCTEELFTLDDDKKNFNMAYWINPDRGELFFAEKIIIVEGPTDKTIIPYLSKKLSIFKYEYTIIDCGGKDNIKIYIHLLNKFRLPYVAVYDKDNQAVKTADAINNANKSSKEIEDAIDQSLGKSIIFENDIEEEIGIIDENNKNKPYFSLKHVSDDSFVLSEGLKKKIEAIFN
ncbi:MAG: ATP-dependent endonuclease [Candidatus Yanofskybacteria bacterium CG10_big_fil_rev_8_21_14_0_10_37_15]|uniref:ATP-dependent endonuclease n=1 Tax=Candidatus Yanofskybacteria bacterium CG10_big_fil_rev_8_21_14_0_10_37_15 TaxID=1975097 RepID=A0A2H0R6L7_9BACT|nr:MAG: ATP-dependent endonuclease [Candidatus Yanofskybacteria bacterium CG10_big_fil_rev_8_21_14_0_10_37_15]